MVERLREWTPAQLRLHLSAEHKTVALVRELEQLRALHHVRHARILRLHLEAPGPTELHRAL